MSRIISYIIICLLSSFTIKAETRATISNVRIDYNYKLKSGNYALKVTFKMDLQDCTNDKCIAMISLYDNNKSLIKKPLKSKNYEVDQLMKYFEFYPPYSSTTYNNASFEFPFNDMELNAGSHNLNFKIHIWNITKMKDEILCGSDFFPFRVNVPGQNLQTNSYTGNRTANNGQQTASLMNSIPLNRTLHFSMKNIKDSWQDFHFTTDRDNDIIASVTTPLGLIQFLSVGQMGEYVKFVKFTYAAESVRDGSYLYTNLPRYRLTGRTIKQKDEKNVLLFYSADHICWNGNDYYRLSEAEYQKRLEGNPNHASPRSNGNANSFNSNTSISNGTGGNKTQQMQCTDCSGSGKCRMCNGQGYSYNPHSTSGSTTYLKCRWCHGSKQCPTCNGRGNR